MRKKMSSRRALLTSVIMTVVPTALFAVSSATFSPYLILMAAILINWPVIRWLDDRQWYREWIRMETSNK
ncbi:hypothetical protein EV08_0099 [Prochlorococcus marinus str. SS2]|uniref:Uncharacterized protein n=3 Tax=Prochlorococcaceae TaxID=2881426 RepID=Q7VCR2_PROMA|nr:Predicted protein [Prochlorococcus marinus subsp. marinus str. CCMP1375]KGG14426.1 hypothetical protein EV04_0003 [Prochlorococcus marinus str. LG]KGG22584.1 hypothetical protein EV08_0099 [Prochlorococcus marinus str. SS2]